MGYMHIENTYKNQDILLFKECYALEKVHGTSAQVDFTAALGGPDSWVGPNPTGMPESFEFFGGCVKAERFKKIVLEQSPDLLAKIKALDPSPEKITIYGEAYGGSTASGMSGTYGKDVRFIVFDIQIGDKFLDVPNAVAVTAALGLEFVPWQRIPATEEAINAARDFESIVASRRAGGVSTGKLREGVVLRPLIELTRNNGTRVMSKHKHKDFEERMNPPKIEDPNKLQKLTEARAIADEWVTYMRLEHILDKIPKETQTMQNMKKIIEAMIEDVYREGKGELVESRETSTAIGARTAKLFKILEEERISDAPVGR